MESRKMVPIAYLQGRNRHKDVENRPEGTVKRKRVGQTERAALKQMHGHV